MLHAMMQMLMILCEGICWEESIFTNLQVRITIVRLLKPTESSNRRVSLLFLKGTWLLFCCSACKMTAAPSVISSIQAIIRKVIDLKLEVTLTNSNNAQFVYQRSASVSRSRFSR